MIRRRFSYIKGYKYYIDLNAFQHYKYLNTEIEQFGYDITSIGDTYISATNVYSSKITDLSQIKEGDKIAVANDAVNLGCALNVLQAAGLLTVDSSKGLVPAVSDITSNPLNLEIIEVDASQTPSLLPDVAAAVINGDYAVDSGLSPANDAIFYDNPSYYTSNDYVNVIAARTADKDNEIYKKVVKAYQTDATEQVYNTTFQGTYIAAWKSAPADSNTDLPYLIETRRYLHRNPELSMREYNTAAFIRNELSRFGIEYRTVDETGTFARIDGKAPGKTVLLRADIDVLPVYEKTGLAFSSENEGVMHACGHDFHTAALLGAAKELSALRDIFSGTILLAFQQAEESQHGSKFFVREGLTKGYDRAFGIHISPAFPAGKIAMTRGTDAASCDYFKITLRGKSAHISKPHLGNDALAAAAELALKLPSIQPRVLNPLDNSVIGIGRLTAGTSYNIIANEAVLEGTIRTLTFETQEFLQNKVRETAEAVAALYDVIPEVELETFAYPVINDDDAFDEAYAAAAKIVGEENIITDRKLIMGFGADDFSEFQRYAKGVYVHVGTANAAESSQLPLHSDRLTPDESALAVMEKLHVEYALSVLNK